MAHETKAPHLHLVQPARPKTAAERAAAYRARKAAEKAGKPPSNEAAQINMPPSSVVAGLRTTSPLGVLAISDVTEKPSGSEKSESGTPRHVTPVTPVTTVTPEPVTPSRPLMAYVLMTAAFGLTGVGIVVNGSFWHSLGSGDVAGWAFLAIGVAADLVALAIPSSAARLWQTRQRLSALAAWAIWLTVIVFVSTAGIGFASTSVTDVTTSRASRVTPAVTAASDALRDAVTSRDRECKGGVGKFCREREAAVVERRAALDAAMKTVEQAADPQTESASRIVAWLSVGLFRPEAADFAMLRLIMLALLPQLGGLLLMIGRVR